MNKRANLYFAALLGAMSPLCTVSALAAKAILPLLQLPSSKTHVQVLLKTLPENLSSAQPSESKVRPVEP